MKRRKERRKEKKKRGETKRVSTSNSLKNLVKL